MFYSYTEQMSDKLYLMKSKIDFAYRIFWGEDYYIESIDHLFQVNINMNFLYIFNYDGYSQGFYQSKKYIDTYNWSYNREQRKFIKVKESQYKCLDLNDVYDYDNKYFDFYQIIVSLNDSKKDSFYNINDYLLNKDCKIELSFTDNGILLDDYSKPFIPYNNSVFLRLMHLWLWKWMYIL